MVDCIEAVERPQNLKNSGALSADEFQEQQFRLFYEVVARSNVSSAKQRFDENRDTASYAGFWRRFVAFVIDSIIIIVIGYIGGGFIGLVYGCIAEAATGGGMSRDSVGVEAGALGFIWGIAADYIYFTALESSSMQATPGKLAFNIIVTNYEFRRIGFASGCPAQGREPTIASASS